MLDPARHIEEWPSTTPPALWTKEPVLLESARVRGISKANAEHKYNAEHTSKSSLSSHTHTQTGRQTDLMTGILTPTCWVGVAV